MITAESVFEGKADPSQATDDCMDLGEAISKHALRPDFARSPEALANFAGFFRGIEDDVAAVTIWSGMSGYHKTNPLALDVVKWLHGSCVHRLQAVFGVPV